jgi:hypothetical protein
MCGFAGVLSFSDSARMDGRASLAMTLQASLQEHTPKGAVC